MSTALFLVLSFIGYILSVVIYRLTLHPLAKYPGPFWAKVTSWYDVYHCCVEDRHEDQWKCQQIYGNIFRYGPNHLILNTPGALKDLYANGKSNNVRKSVYYTFLHANGICNIHSAIDKDLHAFKRRVMSHAFSEQSLRNLEPYMIQQIERWLDHLTKDARTVDGGWSTPRNMANWATYMTFDVLGKLCFGEHFDMVGSEKNRGVPLTIMGFGKNLQVIGNSPLLSSFKLLEQTPVMQWMYPKATECVKELFAFIDRALNQRVQSAARAQALGSEENKDFVYHLSRARDPVTGQGYTRDELNNELRLLLVAGSDTTAVTLAATLFFVIKHPLVLKELQHEIRTKFRDAKEIMSGPELTSCTYLRACVDETLRLASPVPSSLPREVLEGGMVVDGIFLPKGTVVSTSAFAIMRDKRYYRQPLEFRPERWLTGHVSDHELLLSKSVFCAWSMGSRGCIGKTLAYNELSIAIARLLFTFDLRLVDGDITGEDEQGLYQLHDLGVCKRDGPIVQFRKRADL